MSLAGARPRPRARHPLPCAGPASLRCASSADLPLRRHRPAMLNSAAQGILGQLARLATHPLGRIGSSGDSLPRADRGPTGESIPSSAPSGKPTHPWSHSSRWRIRLVGFIAAATASRGPSGESERLASHPPGRIGPSPRSLPLGRIGAHPASRSPAGWRPVRGPRRVARHRRGGRAPPRGADRRGPCGSGVQDLFGAEPCRQAAASA